MHWIRRLYHRIALARRGPDPTDVAVEQEIKATKRQMESSTIFGMQVRDSRLRVVEHCSLVSLIAGLIGKRTGLPEADLYTLQTAARLHELGTLALPQELLLRTTPLTTEELRKVRSQAEISAAVAKLAHPPRVAELIRHQYDEHFRLERAGHLSGNDILLAGILRVADVLAAVTWPRPYQDPMPADQRDALLRSGAGTHFHPLAVDSALRLRAFL